MCWLPWDGIKLFTSLFHMYNSSKLLKAFNSEERITNKTSNNSIKQKSIFNFKVYLPLICMDPFNLLRSIYKDFRFESLPKDGNMLLLKRFSLKSSTFRLIKFSSVSLSVKNLRKLLLFFYICWPNKFLNFNILKTLFGFAQKNIFLEDKIHLNRLVHRHVHHLQIIF